MSQLSRRQLVQGAGAVGLGLLAGCGRLPGQAQAPAKVPRVGWLGIDGTPEAIFRETFRELGYVEGQNVIVEWQYTTGQLAQLQLQAAELVALPVDVILTSGSPATTEAARAATSTLPIVMVYPGDPVAAGLVESLASPGGNVTGLTGFQAQLAPKRLEVLKESIPHMARVAVPKNPDRPPSPLMQPGGSVQVAAETLGVQLLPLEVRRPRDLDTALQTATMAGADAVLWGGTLADGDFRSPDYRSRLVTLAAQYQLPAMSVFSGWAHAGLLMSYTANTLALHRRAAYYVDRILKGAQPADLPVEQPTRFDFVINLNTAQALGLTIPHHVMLQATEVLQ
jgi:putative tryptophan/tyrosine transport system substrate-binding protein